MTFPATLWATSGRDASLDLLVATTSRGSSFCKTVTRLSPHQRPLVLPHASHWQVQTHVGPCLRLQPRQYHPLSLAIVKQGDPGVPEPRAPPMSYCPNFTYGVGWEVRARKKRMPSLVCCFHWCQDLVGAGRAVIAPKIQRLATPSHSP